MIERPNEVCYVGFFPESSREKEKRRGGIFIYDEGRWVVDRYRRGWEKYGSGYGW